MISMLPLVSRAWGCGALTDTTVGVTKEIVTLIKCATSVGGLALGHDIAVRVMDEARADISVNLAHTSGLQLGMANDLVLRVQVPSLIDINLAMRGPLLTSQPESWPGTANGLGQVSKLGDEETLAVRVQTLDSDTLTAMFGPLGVVDTDEDVVGVDGIDETKLEGVGLALIPYMSPVGVFVVPLELHELEVLEKVGWCVLLGEDVLLGGSDARGKSQGKSAQLRE